MVALIVALAIGLVVGLLTSSWHPVWGGVFGVLAFMGVQLGIGLLVRKKVMRATAAIQAVMQEGQQKIARKIQIFQQKPPGGAKTMQKLLEKDQQDSLRQALEAVNALEPFRRWNLVMGKQIATMRMQLHYQLKEFDKVDALAPKALYLDPMTVAMRMARMHANNDPGLEKFYKKKVAKFKGDQGVILYALYSWILLKRGDLDGAIKVLVAGKTRSANETLASNWDHLVNGREKRFSNAALGDQWYALGLEEPKVKQQQQRFQRPF